MIACVKCMSDRHCAGVQPENIFESFFSGIVGCHSNNSYPVPASINDKVLANLSLSLCLCDVRMKAQSGV